MRRIPVIALAAIGALGLAGGAQAQLLGGALGGSGGLGGAVGGLTGEIAGHGRLGGTLAGPGRLTRDLGATTSRARGEARKRAGGVSGEPARSAGRADVGATGAVSGAVGGATGEVLGQGRLGGSLESPERLTRDLAATASQTGAEARQRARGVSGEAAGGADQPGRASVDPIGGLSAGFDARADASAEAGMRDVEASASAEGSAEGSLRNR